MKKVIVLVGLLLVLGAIEYFYELTASVNGLDSLLGENEILSNLVASAHR